MMSHRVVAPCRSESHHVNTSNNASAFASVSVTKENAYQEKKTVHTRTQGHRSGRQAV